MKFIWYLQGFTKWKKNWTKQKSLSNSHHGVKSRWCDYKFCCIHFFFFVSTYLYFILEISLESSWLSVLSGEKKVFYAKNTEVATEKLQFQATTSQLLTQDSYEGKTTIFRPSTIIRYLLSSKMGTEDFGGTTENLVIPYTYTYCLYPIKISPFCLANFGSNCFSKILGFAKKITQPMSLGLSQGVGL